MVAAGPNVFLTYSNGALLFEENAAAFCDAARHAGFDQAIHYRQSGLPVAFRVENEAILTQARGAGYWLWKPFIILETLSKLPPGAALVYSDAGRGLAGTMTFFDGLPSRGRRRRGFWRASATIGQPRRGLPSQIAWC